MSDDVIELCNAPFSNFCMTLCPILAVKVFTVAKTIDFVSFQCKHTKITS